MISNKPFETLKQHCEIKTKIKKEDESDRILCVHNPSAIRSYDPEGIF
jgi:hypothetical protein